MRRPGVRARTPRRAGRAGRPQAQCAQSPGAYAGDRLGHRGSGDVRPLRRGQGSRLSGVRAGPGAGALAAGGGAARRGLFVRRRRRRRRARRPPSASRPSRPTTRSGSTRTASAARQLAAYTTSRATDENAALIRKIAEQPTGEWIGPDDPRGARPRATPRPPPRPGGTALLVLYNIPHRDCGQFSRGGAADGDAYRAWVDQVAAGIGDRPATVVLEPDAILHLVDGCTPHAVPRGAVRPPQGRRRSGSSGSRPPRCTWTRATPAGSHPDALDEPLRRAGIDERGRLRGQRLQLPDDRREPGVRQAAVARRSAASTS